MVSPQRWGKQFVRHDAFGRFEFAPPRSQTSDSVRLSMIASPQRGSLQSARHGAFAVFALFAPASHCSPFAESMMPLPQPSVDLQSAEQPSPEVVLPSSHASPVSVMPSPQR
jgi:hypothetical protein